ncbi:MAG: hypothetical protein HC764_06055 [Pleurocapsa sp. CRU_1_2]|nr:hypothetical protein [Pleurocapsa sp. CRU_1_2]
MNTDQSQQLSSGNLNDLANSKPTVTAHKLHKYVWGLVGIVGLFLQVFPSLIHEWLIIKSLVNSLCTLLTGMKVKKLT